MPDASTTDSDELKYGNAADVFKPLSDVMLPDPRQKGFVVLGPYDASFRDIRLEDYHKELSEITLNSSVPEDVRIGFDTARNLCLYSWFVYRFQPVAELQGYAVLEYALGKRMGPKNAEAKRGLSARLDFAIDEGWLRDEGLRQFQRMAGLRQEYAASHGGLINLNESNTTTFDTYVRQLKGPISRLRNSLAHGNPMLHPNAAHTLEICCDLINQLFPENHTDGTKDKAANLVL